MVHNGNRHHKSLAAFLGIELILKYLNGPFVFRTANQRQ